MSEIEKVGLPYGAEYAKSSRAKCKDKDCESEIDSGTLRLSVRIKSSFSDGLQDMWYHDKCFWKHARRGINEAMIRNFEHLKWNDQEMLRNHIKRKIETEGDDTGNKPTKANYAKRISTCIACKDKMEKGALRIEHKNAFYHPQCVADLRIYLKQADELDGFDDLREEDQDVLAALFTGPNEDDLKKIEDAKEQQLDLMGESEEHKEKLKRQTDLIWEAKDALTSSIRENKAFKGVKGKKEAAEALLVHNGGNAFAKGAYEDFAQLLADIIVFGGFEKCPECGEANFYYSPDRRVYQCVGKGKDDPCSYFSRDVARKPFQINKATSKTGLAEYDGKILIPEGRVFSKAVESHAEEEKLISLEPKPVKKIDPSRKRKPEPEGPVRENGFAVDPYFSNPDDFHVYIDEDGNPCQYLLHKIDEKTGDKRFYKIQLLEADSGDEWRVFRRYGVVLTDSTKDMVTNFDDLDKAMKLFEGQFREKAEMDWKKREEKKPDQELGKKYSLVEWKQSFSGTYGRTSKETFEEDGATTPKKSKKIKIVDDCDTDE